MSCSKRAFRSTAVIIKAEPFPKLSVYELYEILRLRSAVFVAEQDCAYQDIDGIDPSAVHVWGTDEGGKLLAYLRIFRDAKGTVRLGRVVTSVRSKGYGEEILKEGIRIAEEDFDAEEILIEAQVRAAGFYRRHGFEIVSEPFMEDGIPHVRMLRKK